MRELPSAREEERLFSSGAVTVAGVDEVGRGAWAGPLSVGVVVVTAKSLSAMPAGVADSKLLSPVQRERLFSPLSASVLEYAIGHATSLECDELGMTKAQRLATSRAFDQLICEVDAVIVDGRTDFVGRGNSTIIVGADRLCISVAAASVLAKVTRDRHMVEVAASYLPYGFDRNKGYPSPDHIAALAAHGLTDLHRKSWSFAPGYGSARDSSGTELGAS
jgi:ribonuclease HII